MKLPNFKYTKPPISIELHIHKVFYQPISPALVSHEPTQEDVQSELTDLANYLCDTAKIERLPLRFKNVKSYSGKAFIAKRYIAISNKRVVAQPNKYFRDSIVIHEVCHFIYVDWYKESGALDPPDYHGHDFKRIETKWLWHFGMVPHYGGIYIHTLSDFFGEALWSNR